MSLETKSQEFIEGAWPGDLPPSVVSLAKATFCAGAIAAMESIMVQTKKGVSMDDIKVNFLLEALMMVPKEVIADAMEKRTGGGK